MASRIPDEIVDALLERAGAIVSSSDHREAVHWSKAFFESNLPGQSNFDLLTLFHREIWSEIADKVAFDVPVIDHAILLIKGAGAAGTGMHQDRAYWVERDPSPSIFSVWIALGDMSAEGGGLMLSVDNQVRVDDMSSFNTGSVFEHEQRAGPVGGFPITIPNRVAARVAESMGFIQMAKGEAVAFDSFEPHMSGPNTTATPRLAMKIAYSEGREKARFLSGVDTLERGF